MPDNQALFDGFKSHKTIREAIANIVPGMQELADIDVARKEFSVKGRLLHTAKFNTPDGKARFVAHSVPQEKKHNNTYPYTLMSVRSEGQFNSIIYEERDSYRGTDQRQVVMMSAEDMKLLKIKQGSQVSVRSEHGVMRSLTVHQFDLPAGNLMVYYPEANVLIGRKADPRSQTPAFKSVAVAVDLDQ